MKAKRSYTIGRNDMIDLPELGLFDIKAKVDTGAFTSALHCSRIKMAEREGQQLVTFQISRSSLGRKGSVKFETKDSTQRKIKSSTGHIENRVIIKTQLIVFGRRFKTEFSLTDRSGMKFPVLLGRKFLKKGFIVDVSRENLSFLQKQEGAKKI